MRGHAGLWLGPRPPARSCDPQDLQVLGTDSSRADRRRHGTMSTTRQIEAGRSRLTVLFLVGRAKACTSPLRPVSNQVCERSSRGVRSSRERLGVRFHLPHSIQGVKTNG